MINPRAENKQQEGSALVLAIFVLFLLSSMGIALLYMTDSDLKMNKAGLRAKAAFYQAEAGLEDARNALRVKNLASANPSSYSDELAAAAGANGTIQLDPATLAPIYNSAGQVTGFTGYGDDVPLRSFTTLNGGWHAAFLTNDPIDGRTSKTDTNDRLMITSIGATSDRAVEVIQAIVDRKRLPSLPATVTMLGPAPAEFTGGSSGAQSYSGNDCASAAGYTGIPGLHMPVVGTIGSASQAAVVADIGGGKGTYNSGSHSGASVIDDSTTTTDPIWTTIIDPQWTTCMSLESLAASVRSVADYVCTSASSCSHWSTSTISTITYVDGDLNLGPGDSGKGLLWVTGTLSMRGNTNWEGSVIVVGKGNFQRSGGGDGHTWGGIVVANIAGPDGIYGNADDCTGGTGGYLPATYDSSGNGKQDIDYCSDAINQSMGGFPFKIVDFRQR